jgi:glutathione peroxidase
MGLYDIPLTALDATPTTLPEGTAVLVVNVASKCGLTPQYAGLEQLQQTYGDRGFTVLGVPCNQFKGQEPGSAEEIAEFCSATYGVSFPLLAKADVNGPDRHPLFEELTAAADAEGNAGDVQWNFEKWLISTEGKVIGRYRPLVQPDDPALIADIEAALPA